MKPMYRLLPVQVENLKKQYMESVCKLKELNVLKNDEMSDKKGITDNEICFSADTSLLGSLSIAANDYKEAKEKLDSYEIIENNNSDIIGLGSTFEAQMNYEGLIETETFTLVEVRNHKDDRNLISVDSPLGKSAQGKTIGDTIGYTVEKRRITG